MKKIQILTPCIFFLLTCSMHAMAETETIWEKVDDAELEPRELDKETIALMQDFLKDNSSDESEIRQPPMDIPFDYSFDEGTIAPRKTKLLTEIGGIDVPATEYAQTMIQKYVTRFSNGYGKKNLIAALERGEVYRFYIRQELAKRGMPTALEYLPVVESEYRTRATSRSGAQGIWQFMENSVAPFMIKNDWMDERNDPWKSTDAALSKLQENYDMFGDWAIAIAAYNCGAGAMRKFLRENPDKNFWEMAEQDVMKEETTLYIPKFLAIAEIALHQEEYEVELPELQEESDLYEFDILPVKEAIHLAILASEMRTDYDNLKNLNASLTRFITPPNREYELRLPAGMKETAQEAIEAIRKKRPSDYSGIRTYKVQDGDSLWGIARRNKCTVEDICFLNNRKEKQILKIGEVLLIP